MKIPAPDRLTLDASYFQSNHMAPAKGTTKALARPRLSKLNHMAFGLAVYASWYKLPDTTQDSLPAVGQTLPDGLLTRRVTIEGFKFTSCQSSYQSDEVDHTNGPLVRQCNRRLRGAMMQVAENLIKCHPYYRGLSGYWKQRKVDPHDRRWRVANRATRMVYQLVGGRQVWRGQGVDREYILAKLQEFHRVHKTPIEQSVRDMTEAFAWLPKSTYASESQPLVRSARKRRRGPQRIGELLVPLLIRLGVFVEEEDSPPPDTQGSE